MVKFAYHLKGRAQLRDTNSLKVPISSHGLCLGMGAFVISQSSCGTNRCLWYTIKASGTQKNPTGTKHQIVLLQQHRLKDRKDNQHLILSPSQTPTHPAHLKHNKTNSTFSPLSTTKFHRIWNWASYMKIYSAHWKRTQNRYWPCCLLHKKTPPQQWQDSYMEQNLILNNSYKPHNKTSIM